MNNTKRFTLILIILLTVTAAEFAYLRIQKTPDGSDKMIRQSFTLVTGLPDLSVYTESPHARHRSLAAVGQIFGTDPFAPDHGLSGLVYKKAER